jgi:tyrosyl-tRNA synthetase
MENTTHNIDLAGLESVTTEILGREDLIRLLSEGKPLNHYIGFEISGLVHLGTGLMAGLVMRELQKLGIHTRIWLADWHSWINNKMGGDRELIKKVALEYFAEAMLVSAQIAGADPSKVEVLLGTDVYHHNDRFWATLIDVSKNLTLSRVLKSTTIMGRQASDSMEFAQLIYPPLQVADIFELQAHIAHAGTDQRKCHVIAREVAMGIKANPLQTGGEQIKPIAIHHHLLQGLVKPDVEAINAAEDKSEAVASLKMSKSVAGSAIFIHDTEDEIKSKIRAAYAPEKIIELNPIIDWVEHMILPITGQITVEREERFGGSFTATNITEIKERYTNGDLHPLDLKNALSQSLIEILRPARAAFASAEKQALIAEITASRTR